MFRRILFLALSFIILSTQAFAVSGDGLKKAFDEFNYSVSVEWDQKDKAFYAKQFKNKV